MIIIETLDKKQYWTEAVEETPEFFIFDRKFKSGVVHKYKISKRNISVVIDGVKAKGVA